MSRVLIWKKKSPGSEYDIYRGIDCIEQYTKPIQYNVGNRLWLQGLMSSIDTGENEYTYLSNELTPDAINSGFDFIILPMANIFNKLYQQNIRSLAEEFSSIRIPVYVIACGAQAESFDLLGELISQIGEDSKRFISAIYATGGEFALRGHFTKEFFVRLGFPSAVVTGCPSLYQMGRDFSVPGRKSDPESIVPVFNGRIDLIENVMRHYDSSIYLDQDALWGDLYAPKSHHPTFRNTLAFYHNNGEFPAELLAQDRIRLIPDMHNWRSFLIDQQFTFAFGTRIHGNIMAILSGIPAVVAAVDSRTREMAEFYDIPLVMPLQGQVYSMEEFSEIYDRANYTKFNQSFADKYDAYAAFLIDHKIVSQPNSVNRFFSHKNPYVPPLATVNTAYFQQMTNTIKRARPLLDLACFLADHRRR